MHKQITKIDGKYFVGWRELAIPSENDWKVKDDQDLDYLYAKRSLFGKSQADVKHRFAGAYVIEACDELRWIPEVPFRYYLLAFSDVVLNINELDDYKSDVASCYLHLIQEKLVSNPQIMSPIIKLILPAVIFVSNNQSQYDAPIEIYGDFKIKGKEIMLLIDNYLSSLPIKKRL